MKRCLLFVLCLQFAPANAQLSNFPAYVLKLPSSIETVLIAETDSATLYRFKNSVDGLQQENAQRMSIGQNGVGKQRSGDRRTPLGIYFVIDELDTTRLHEKYGPLAFPLDYPNVWDQLNGRSGYGIWIHGVPPNSGPRPARDTDGCISLPNEELLVLEKFLAPLQTPVIVTRRLRHASRAELDEQRESLLAALESWVSSFQNGDWHRFLSLYAEDFEYRGLSRDEWSAYRVRTAADRPIDGFSIAEVLLLADPEETDLYLSRFRQTINEADRTIETTKRLYWRKSASGEFEIVAEDNG